MPYQPTAASYLVPEDDASGVVVTAGNLLAVLQAALDQGEVELASRLYEESGHPVADSLLAALLRRPGPLRAKAAKMFALARDFGRAAQVHEASADWAAAAQLYEEAGEFAAAARCHLEAGEHRRAAECLDSVGEHLRAADLYDTLGEHESQADCLVRAARHLNTLGPGDYLGEISMLCNSPTSARVVATTWVRSLQIPRAQFERFLVTHPGAALRIYPLFAEGLAGRVRVLSVG